MDEKSLAFLQALKDRGYSKDEAFAALNRKLAEPKSFSEQALEGAKPGIEKTAELYKSGEIGGVKAAIGTAGSVASGVLGTVAERGMKGMAEVLPYAAPGAGKFTITPEDSPLTGVAKTVGNIPGSAYNLLAGTVNLGATAIGEAVGAKPSGSTGGAILGGISGLGKSAIDKVGQVAVAGEEKGYIAGASKALDIASKTLGENPVEALSAVKPEIIPQTAQLATKAVGKVAAPVLGAATKYGTEALGKVTGTSGETIRQAFKSAGEEGFTKALRGQKSADEVLMDVKSGMEQIKDQRSLLYGEDYAKLQESAQNIDLAPVRQSFMDKLTKDYRVGIGEDGKLDFSRSTITGKTAQSELQGAFDDIARWDETTPVGLDVLKRRTADRWRGVQDSKASDAIITGLKNDIKAKIAEEVPAYNRMSATYERISQDIKEIERSLSLNRGAMPQTAVTKLNSILRDNFTARKQMVELLEQYTGKDIFGQVAGLQLNSVMGRGLMGLAQGGVGLYAVFSNPALILALAASSPRLVGEFANALGKGKKWVQNAFDNIRGNVPKPVATGAGVRVSGLLKQKKLGLFDDLDAIREAKAKRDALEQVNLANIAAKQSVESQPVARPMGKHSPVEKFSEGSPVSTPSVAGSKAPQFGEPGFMATQPAKQVETPVLAQAKGQETNLQSANGSDIATENVIRSAKEFSGYPEFSKLPDGTYFERGGVTLTKKGDQIIASGENAKSLLGKSNIDVNPDGSVRLSMNYDVQDFLNDVKSSPKQLQLKEGGKKMPAKKPKK